MSLEDLAEFAPEALIAAGAIPISAHMESPDNPVLPCGHRSPITISYRVRPAMRADKVRFVWLEPSAVCASCSGPVPLRVAERFKKSA